jgi:rSAM/selenodomain-associated transferase 2
LPSPSIAVIVPALDEESVLASNLPPLVAQADEVILSDGGSEDRTVAIARELGATLVEGPPGRGNQLNLGAAAATSDVLLFVHADTALPAEGVAAVRAAIAEGAVGGGFLVAWHSERPILRLGGRLTNLRTRLTHCPLGDQAQFCRRDTFEQIGGFPDWPILEDLDFSRRLKRRGSIALLEPPVSASPRRYQTRGITRTIVTNWLIWVLYFLGVSPARLGRLYENVR